MQPGINNKRCFAYSLRWKESTVTAAVINHNEGQLKSIE